MANTERPSTPPRAPAKTTAQSPNTPEQVRRMEEARLRAKAIRSQNSPQPPTNRATNSYPAPVAGQKRPHSDVHSSSSLDARMSRAPNSNNGLASTQDAGIRAARKFQKFVEYDFSKMTDTKGGFMTQEDDPFNKALHAPDNNSSEAQKPAGMSIKEWEMQQMRKRLREQRAGPYEPGLSVLNGGVASRKCRECGSLEIDFQFMEELKCLVCHACKEKMPEKYSLLTKSEAKEDYLLTDPELKDVNLLPRMEKPNPHKSTWHNMQLFLRFQVEQYAFSEKKWGSAEKLDEEFEKRQQEAKARKDKKFRNKLNELKKRTRVDAYKKERAGGGGNFGDVIGTGRHEHEWGRSVENPATGMMKKSCIECGMEVEELEF